MRLETGIDYLSFTLKTGGLQRAIQLLGDTPEPLQAKERGLYGYKFSLSCPGVTILHTPNERNDVHIQITGTGCVHYGERLLSMVPEDANISRCDVRCDVLGGLMSVEEIWGYLQRRCYVGNARTINLIFSVKSDEYAGATIYLGAKTSDVRLRMYDKGAESGTTKNPRQWVRFEFQLRNESASWGYWDCIKRNETECFLNFLHKTIRLTARPNTSVSEAHRCRLLSHDRWVKTFGHKMKVIYHSSCKMASFQGMMKHIQNCGAILKVLRSIRPDFDDILHLIADKGKLKEHHMLLAHELRHDWDFGYVA